MNEIFYVRKALTSDQQQQSTSFEDNGSIVQITLPFFTTEDLAANS